MTRLKSNRIAMVMLVVLSVFATRALVGDEINGFVDGLVVGFTDNV